MVISKIQIKTRILEERTNHNLYIYQDIYSHKISKVLRNKKLQKTKPEVSYVCLKA